MNIKNITILGCIFASFLFGGLDAGLLGKNKNNNNSYNNNSGRVYQEGEVDPNSSFVSGPCVCYCPVTRYKPEYYCETHCVQEPYECKKRCCRYRTETYTKQHCRYVPQYYTKTYCRQVPEYYDECETKYRTKHVKEKKCCYKPYTCIEKRCCDCPSN